MTPEEILQITAKEHMVGWNHKSFKDTHPNLYKTIINAIGTALGVKESIKSLPNDESIVKISNKIRLMNETRDPMIYQKGVIKGMTVMRSIIETS